MLSMLSATEPLSEMRRLPAAKTFKIVCETKSGDLPEAFVPAVLRERERGVVKQKKLCQTR